MPDSTSAAADEGTHAHKIAETYLLYLTGKTKKFQFETDLAALKADARYAEGMNEMIDYVEEFVDYVMEQFNVAKAEDPNAVIYLETEVDLSAVIPEAHGTLDVRIVNSRKLRIIDLKFGKGVPVFAENNVQLRIYALGGILVVGSPIFDYEEVEMTIHQPRLDSITTAVMTIDALWDWADAILIPRAKLAFAGEGEFKPGKWCKFCKVAGNCKALADHHLEVAKHDWADPEFLTDEDISDILDRAKMFVDWVKSVKDFALKEAVTNGKVWPGYKIVAGRTDRMYLDQVKAADIMMAEGMNFDDVWTVKLIAITNAEKALGKKKFNDKLSGVVGKPDAPPTLAPLSDKRPVYAGRLSADDEFADEFEEE